MRVHGNGRWNTSVAWRLPCLLLALAMGGSALAGPAGAPVLDDGKHGPAPAGYRVVNLGSGDLSALPKINAKGQVAFSLWDGAASHGYFFDGERVRDIGTLGGSDTVALGLNDAGQVAGGSFTAAGGERAFVWSAGGGMLDLGVLPGAGNSRAQAINRHGVVTGYAEGVPSTPPLAFRWSRTDGMTSLGALAPDAGGASFGAALNDAGLIAGAADTASFDRHAFAWTATRGLADIDTLGSSFSDVVAVGARGEVAGSRVPAGNALLYRAFLWTPGGGMRDLGAAGAAESFALAMSPGARIAGLVNLAGGDQRAMTWTRAEGMRVLGTFGGANSRAIQANDRGQVVGYATDRTQDFRAFLWSARSGLVDLNTRLRQAPPGLVLDDALAINDDGAIVASSNAGLVLLTPGAGAADGHVVGPVVAPDVVPAGTAFAATVAWVDPGRVGTRGVRWSWGDGSGVQAGRVREGGSEAGVGSARASHHFARPGVYRVAATVLDSKGRGTTVSHTVVAAAAGAGTVAAKGSVLSPRGAWRKAPAWVGKAGFSLVAPVAGTVPAAQSAQSATVPAQLRFDLPGLRFYSASLRFLGRQGAQRVFEGEGTINGAGSYRARLATTLGLAGAAPGRFALKIWQSGAAPGNEVVHYDNSGTLPGAVAAPLVDARIVTE
ncbi:PKD domain-containing protein [Massilia sp. G4R7]|uniref:PKD domain-containing protein n=1 Tax=Massilia phyllostachyos TaxID=2898585 RepID=A0ABS8Q642_9BURK|nr:PKD domain-containing protein [Massilia phyllostachyos]MCD2517215.1 PKD domain-containing protein [Massilia phyllostachyos]